MAEQNLNKEQLSPRLIMSKVNPQNDGITLRATVPASAIVRYGYNTFSYYCYKPMRLLLEWCRKLRATFRFDVGTIITGVWRWFFTVFRMDSVMDRSLLFVLLRKLSGAGQNIFNLA